jgi:hypothetical protein
MWSLAAETTTDGMPEAPSIDFLAKSLRIFWPIWACAFPAEMTPSEKRPVVAHAPHFHL